MADDSGSAPRGDAIDRVVRWDSDIVLEENASVINVFAYASPDPLGGFLVWDEQEAQIRRYDERGRLLNYFGRKGDGPREFQFVKGAIRRSSGTILTFDAYYRGAEFDRHGTTVLRSFRTPVGPLQSALLLNDTLVLLGGRIAGSQGDTRLHLFSIADGAVRRSFFAPELHGAARQMAGNTAGFVSADRRGDTLAVVFSLNDTIYLFDQAGNSRGKLPIPSRFYRRLAEKAPLPEAKAGVIGAREWLGSFSLISNVFWMADGTFLVQYQDRVGSEPRWRLMALRRDGKPLFEVYDSPYLLTVDAEKGWLYFVKPGSPTPNVWSRARLRP